MKLLPRAAVPGVAAAFLLAGCAGTQPGPVPVGPLQSPQATPSSSNSGNTDVTGTASLQPCILLTASDVSGYAASFTPAEERKLGGARICRYQHRTTTTSEEGMILSVGIRDDAPLVTVNDTGNGVRDLQVNGRAAKEASSDAPLGCTVALGVGDKARVDVNATGLNTVDRACQIAEDMATKIVEPKLSRG